MSDDHKMSSVLGRHWPVIVAGVGAAAVSIVANLAQIDNLLTSGLVGIVRVTAEFAIFLCTCLLVREKLRRNKTTITCFILIPVCVGLIVLLWPPSSPAPAEASRSYQTPTDSGKTETPATTSPKPVRSLEQWATDINRICAQEATRVGSAFEQFRGAGSKIIELAKQYKINTYLDVAKHADILAPPMRQAFDAAAIVDSSYTTAYRQMTSTESPTDTNEKATAKKWVGRYEQLGDAFHTIYETLANYTANENEYLRATFFTKFALFDGPVYLDMTPQVLDEGRDLGVKSCL